MAVNYLLQTNYYLENHLEYDGADIPEEDIKLLFSIKEKIDVLMRKLAADHRIVIVPSVEEMTPAQKEALNNLNNILKGIKGSKKDTDNND